VDTASAPPSTDHAAAPRHTPPWRKDGRPASIAAAGILFAAAGVHAYWAFGGTWAAATSYGSTALPPRGVVAAVTVLILAAAGLLLARTRVLDLRLPAVVLRWGTWGLAAVFGLAALGNLTAPADSYGREWHVLFFGPLLLTVAFLCVVVARSPIAEREPSR
jgi:hypothetical protein